MNIETADRLVQLRKQSGLSQEALAAKIGVSRQAVSKWERAEASPDTDNLIALAELYGMTLDELLNTVDDKYILSKQPKKKEKKFSEKAVKKGKEILNSALYPDIAKAMFKFPYPIIVAIAYVIICGALSMLGAKDPWGKWWLLFMTIPMYYMVAAACRTTSKKTFLFCMPVPIVVVTLYLMLGLFADLWGAGALLFVAIPLYYWYVIFYVKRDKKKGNDTDETKKENK